MTQLTDNLFAIEVKNDAKHFDIHKVGNYIELTYWSGKLNCDWHDQNLPEGDWEILGLVRAGKVEFDAEPYVDKEDGLYIDYVLFRGHLQNYCDNAAESFLSLLKSKSLDTDKCYLIIERVK